MTSGDTSSPALGDAAAASCDTGDDISDPPGVDSMEGELEEAVTDTGNGKMEICHTCKYKLIMQISFIHVDPEPVTPSFMDVSNSLTNTPEGKTLFEPYISTTVNFNMRALTSPPSFSRDSLTVQPLVHLQKMYEVCLRYITAAVARLPEKART